MSDSSGNDRKRRKKDYDRKEFSESESHQSQKKRKHKSKHHKHDRKNEHVPDDRSRSKERDTKCHRRSNEIKQTDDNSSVGKDQLQLHNSYEDKEYQHYSRKSKHSRLDARESTDTSCSQGFKTEPYDSNTMPSTSTSNFDKDDSAERRKRYRPYDESRRAGIDYKNSEKSSVSFKVIESEVRKSRTARDEKPEYDFDFSQHKASLNRIFFRDQDVLPRGMKEYEDFWAFLQKYQAFQKKKAESGSGKGSANSFASHFLRKRHYNYSFMQEEEEDAGAPKLSQWERRIEKLQAKGGIEEFRAMERRRMKAVRESQTEDQKAHIRALQRVRQARYRANQKDKEQQKITRAEKEKHRAEKAARQVAHREYMRAWRKNMPAEKKEEMKTRRREKRTKVQVHSPVSVPVESSPQTCTLPGSPFRTPMALRKAVSRASGLEPTDPRKYCEVIKYKVTQAAKSPRKRAILKELELIAAPNQIEEKVLGHLQALKQDCSKEGVMMRRKLVKVLISQSTNSITTLSKRLGQRWAFVKKASKLPEEAEEEKKILHGNSIPADLKNKVQLFYQDPECSVIVPDRKMIKRDLVPRAVMLSTLKKAHGRFCSETGDTISLSAFKRLRPQHILTCSNLQRSSCLCKSCANVAQKLEVVAGLLAKIGMQLSKYPREALEMTVCSIDSISCFERKCLHCGVGKLQELLQKLPGEDMVSWLRWQNDGSRMNNVTKQGSVCDLITELVDEIGPYASHIGVAVWQYRQFRALRSALLSGQVLTMMDFAENYRCLYQGEIQSAHWSYTQVTIFATVNYYRCECDELVTESVVIISADMRKDASVVHHYSGLVLDHLKCSRKLQLVKQFTDGAGAQFKSREPFVDISLCQADHGMEIERSYFGSGHGKGPCDGVGGIVKGALARAVLSKKHVIRNAKEAFNFLQSDFTVDPQEHCHSRRVFIYVENSVANQRPDRRPSNMLPGTRQLHCIKSFGKANSVVHRSLSCYCQTCFSGNECDFSQQPRGRWQAWHFNCPKRVLTTADPASSINCQDRALATADHASSTNWPEPALTAEDTAFTTHCPERNLATADPASSTNCQEHALATADPASSTNCQEHALAAAGPASSNCPESDLTTADPVTVRGPSSADMQLFQYFLKKLESFSTFAALKNYVVTEGILSMPSMAVGGNIPSLHDLPKDSVSSPLLPKNVLNMQPLRVLGDGNCLPRCASLLAYGNENHHAEMRVRIIMELVTHMDTYMDHDFLADGAEDVTHNLTTIYASFSGQFPSSAAFDSSREASRMVLEEEIMEVRKNGMSMGMWEVHALSSVLGRPLFSIYPDYGGATVRQYLHRKVLPREVAHEEPGYLMWTSTNGMLALPESWVPNHFVVCVFREDCDVDTLAPGQFLLVNVESKKGGSSQFVAQVTRVTDEGIWGRYLEKYGEGWKWPENGKEYFLPGSDIIKVLAEYTTHQDRRTLYFLFGV